MKSYTKHPVVSMFTHGSSFKVGLSILRYVDRFRQQFSTVPCLVFSFDVLYVDMRSIFAATVACRSRAHARAFSVTSLRFVYKSAGMGGLTDRVFVRETNNGATF